MCSKCFLGAADGLVTDIGQWFNAASTEHPTYLETNLENFPDFTSVLLTHPRENEAEKGESAVER